MPRVYETMRRAQIPFTAGDCTPRLVIRLWVDGHDLHYADHALGVAVDLASPSDSPFHAAEAIAEKIPHLNAVEVVDGDGNGSVIYLDWP